LSFLKPRVADAAAASLGRIRKCARGDEKETREEDEEKGASAMPDKNVLGGDGMRGQELQGWV
jgi:hypothetical protein